jgi:predicted nuclease of predicted toxin-antitoxin system
MFTICIAEHETEIRRNSCSMKFLIDAQLPPSLKQIFLSRGYDCIHTLDLELKNNTTDTVINSISINEERVVITKDNDFF